ncbi:ATP-binding cassette sub-family D member 4 [Sarcoptes scabiei]|uniref:ATP-binding cassette sub-family D member 4 n=1 Tax=Sarcoptes scabiei TaxID=52283 RepID=A0A834RF23_SARSC|nr:ATP-binding cassette sub-family D member 4 [Sarcoptes scabiei]
MSESSSTTTKIFFLHNSTIRLSLLFLLIFAILYEIAVYNIGLITGDYYKILNEKNEKAFLYQTAKSIGLIIAISLVKNLKDYIANYLYVSWRKCLTENLHDNYFRNQSFYRLNVLNSIYQYEIQSPNKSNDNVDQRITQDVDKMFQSLSVLVPEILIAPFLIIFYWIRCQSATGPVGPISCLVLFVIGTSMNYFVIKQISLLVYQQERYEGDFRFQHLRIRNNAEAIVFMSGESSEHHNCQKFLSNLISTQKRLIFRQFFLKFLTSLCDYFGSILSFIAFAIPLFAGVYDNLTPSQLSQLISKNIFFTIYLINCFTRLIDLSVNVSMFLGTFKRVNEIYKWLALNVREEDDDVLSCRVDESEKDSEISVNLKNVTIKNPCDSIIVENLCLPIKYGHNLIISGPSGVGKTSIIRVIKKIWPIHCGTIERNITLNDPKCVMFCSNKPILTTGSIAEQIIYPLVYDRETVQNDHDFNILALNILKFLEIEKSLLKLAANNLHGEDGINWIDHLSAGEIQRFNLARIFYHRPSIVFLDECTTALPDDIARKILYELIYQYRITVVTISHNNSLKSLHQMELKLYQSNRYELIDLSIRTDSGSREQKGPLDSRYLKAE